MKGRKRKSSLKTWTSRDISIVGFPKLSVYADPYVLENNVKRVFRVVVFSANHESAELFLNALVDCILIQDDVENGRLAMATIRQLETKLSHNSREEYQNFIEDNRHICYFDSVRLWFEKVSTELLVEICPQHMTNLENFVGTDYCINIVPENGETEIENLSDTISAICGRSVIKCVDVNESTELWKPHEVDSERERDDFGMCNRFVRYVASACRHLNDMYPGVRNVASHKECLERSLLVLKEKSQVSEFHANLFAKLSNLQAT